MQRFYQQTRCLQPIIVFWVRDFSLVHLIKVVSGSSFARVVNRVERATRDFH